MRGWSDSNVIDWAKAAKGPEPLAEGLYKFRFASAKPTLSKSKGEPMIVLELEIYQDSEGNPLKRKLKDYLPLSQEAAFRAIALCKALDCDAPPDNVATDEAIAAGFCNVLVNAAKDGGYVRIKHEVSTDRRTGEDRTDMRVGRYLNESQVGGSTEEESAPPPRRARGNGAAATA